MPRALLLAATCLAAAAWAQEPSRAGVQQKEMLVRKLLEAGQGRAADAPALALHAKALEHAARGEFKQADARLNEALRALQLERRQAAAPSETRSRYEARLANVKLMTSTYARHAGATRDLHGTLLIEVNEGIAESRRLLDSGREAEALHALELAERALTHALTQVLGSVTVRYASDAAGPRAEYEEELARNRGYAALVPAALDELRPSGAALALVHRYLESAQATTAAAEREAAQERWDSALDNARNATRYLQRALGAAGLAVPQGLAE